MGTNFLADLCTISGLALSSFLIYLIARKSPKSKADGFLIAWFSAAAFHFLYFYVSFHRLADQQSLVQSVGSSLPLLPAPLILLYAQCLSRGKIKQKEILIALLPFFLYSLLYAYLFYQGYVHVSGFQKWYLPSSPFWAWVLAPGLIGWNLVFAWAIWQVVSAHQQGLKDLVSDDARLTLYWLYYWVATLGLGGILIIIVILISDFGHLSPSHAFTVASMLMLVQVWIIAQYGLGQKDIFLNTMPLRTSLASSPNPPLQEKPKPKYAKSGLNPAELQKHKEQLLKIMEEQKPYLRGEINLGQLAQALDLPSYQLSQILNEALETNFYDFIHLYRVKEVQKLLADPRKQHLSLLGIALEAGFNSKSAFNKSFKKFTKMTPSAYRKQLP